MFEADAATISAHLIGVEIVIFAQGGLMVWGFGVMISLKTGGQCQYGLIPTGMIMIQL